MAWPVSKPFVFEKQIQFFPGANKTWSHSPGNWMHLSVRLCCYFCHITFLYSVVLLHNFTRSRSAVFVSALQVIGISSLHLRSPQSSLKHLSSWFLFLFLTDKVLVFIIKPNLPLTNFHLSICARLLRCNLIYHLPFYVCGVCLHVLGAELWLEMQTRHGLINSQCVWLLNCLYSAATQPGRESRCWLLFVCRYLISWGEIWDKKKKKTCFIGIYENVSKMQSGRCVLVLTEAAKRSDYLQN